MKAVDLQLVIPKRVKVTESIIDQIVALIKQGALKNGDKLPSERQLSVMLNVSRSSIREAFQGLSAMDLIEGGPGLGTFIKQPNPTFSLGMDATELSQALQKEMLYHTSSARLLLESEIVGLATQRIIQDSIQELLSVLTNYEASHNEMFEERVWSQHDLIHLSIARATGNPILVQVSRSLLEIVPRVLREKVYRIGSPEEIQERIDSERNTHRQLCLSIVNKDEKSARHWINQHYVNFQNIIERFY